MRTIRFFILLWSFFVANHSFANVTNWQNDILDINIYSKQISQKVSNILVEFNIKDGWFISWDNPGDAGVPTSFDWNKPTIRLNESTPQVVISDNILGQYGYFNKAYYLFETNNTDDEIKLKIKWEACKNECEKQTAYINFFINPSSETFDTVLNSADKSFLNDTNVEATADIEKVENNFFLNLHINKAATKLEEADLYFIPYQKSVIYVADKPSVINNEKEYIIKVKLEKPIIPSQGGLLLNGNNTYKLNIVPIDNAFDISSLIYVILLSFTGGILLNFMPCVFPVLSIKLMSAITSKKNFKGALLYLSGVIFSFLSLATLLYLFRKGGSAIGWGFQLQSPVFVALMLILFIFILLMLLDIIVISPHLINWFNKMGNINTFLSGFFAVLIASPCTGPFLGAALGYTLMQSTKIYFIIFFSLGLGYAMPFTLLELYPNFAAKIMPSSGKWTLRIKYALSVPILFTCLWLAWVLCSQLNTFSNSDKKSIFKPYNTQEIRELINAKKPVFIEFTAKWCLTCLLNEKNVLNNPKFLSLIQEKNINTYRADWTDDDVKIGQAIKSFGRNSVPLYVYYPENSQQYVILPQILTLDNVKSIFNGQNKNRN